MRRRNRSTAQEAARQLIEQHIEIAVANAVPAFDYARNLTSSGDDYYRGAITAIALTFAGAQAMKSVAAEQRKRNGELGQGFADAITARADQLIRPTADAIRAVCQQRLSETDLQYLAGVVTEALAAQTTMARDLEGQ